MSCPCNSCPCKDLLRQLADYGRLITLTGRKYDTIKRRINASVCRAESAGQYDKKTAHTAEKQLTGRSTPAAALFDAFSDRIIADERRYRVRPPSAHQFSLSLSARCHHAQRQQPLIVIIVVVFYTQGRSQPATGITATNPLS